VSLANTSVGGHIYSAEPAQRLLTRRIRLVYRLRYNGNNDTNSVQVGDQTSVQANFRKPDLLQFEQQRSCSLSSLVTALQSGNSSQIETATASVDSAISYVGQQQVFYSNASDQLTSQGQYLQQDTVTLASQENDLIGVDEATAATNLSQAETDNNAALAPRQRSCQPLC